MNLQCAVLAAALVSVVSVSLGGTETNIRPDVADETAEDEWECSLSISTYLVQNIKLAEAIAFGSNERVRAPRLPLAGERREQVERTIRTAIACRPALPTLPALP